MGIDYKAAIVVGLHAEDFTDTEAFDRLKDNEELGQFAPYYDGYECALFGFSAVETRDFSAAELPDDLAVRIEKAKAEFKQLTGQDGKVWLTPVGH